MHVLKSFRPTTTQKQVIATILSAPTPTVAAGTIASTPNMKVARNLLGQLGLITFTDNTVGLTDSGLKLARDEGIADEGGQLTDMGQQLVGSQGASQTNNMGVPGEEPPIGGVPAGGPDDALGGTPSLESFSFLRELMRG